MVLPRHRDKPFCNIAYFARSVMVLNDLEGERYEAISRGPAGSPRRRQSVRKLHTWRCASKHERLISIGIRQRFQPLYGEIRWNWDVSRPDDPSVLSIIGSRQYS